MAKIVQDVALFPYVVVGPQGVVYIGLHADEDGAWWTFLGWPSAEEIEQAKKNGYHCHKAELTWKED